MTDEWRLSRMAHLGMAEGGGAAATACATIETSRVGVAFDGEDGPRRLEKMEKDGNCLFRAVSFWLTADQQRHAHLRDKVGATPNSSIPLALFPRLWLSRDYFR